jgi:hypothetical protein
MPTRNFKALRVSHGLRNRLQAGVARKAKRRKTRLTLESLEPRQMLANEPVAYWAFDDAALGRDTVSGATVLTPVGNAQQTAGGRTGSALRLDGSGDYLEASSFPANIPTGNSAYTISAWLKTTASSQATRGGIVGWGNLTTAREATFLRLRQANGLRHAWWDPFLDSTDAQVAATGTDLDSGAWHHVVAMYDGATRSTWVNGQLVSTDTPGNNNAQATTFRIGKTNPGTGLDDFRGDLDDIAIWNTALAPNQITALATGTSPMSLPPSSQGLIAHWVADDLNGLLDDGDLPSAWNDNIGSRPAAPTGFPTLEKNEINGHSVIRFTPGDGLDQLRVDAANNPMANASTYSVAVVFRADEPGIGAAANWYNNTGIVDGEQAGVANDWGIALASTGQIGAGIGNPDRTAYSTASRNANDGEAHVAIVTRNGATLSVSIDGLAPVTISDAPGTLRGAFDMVFGSLATNQNHFTGDIAEVRVYNTTLGAGEVGTLSSTLMQTYGITVPVSPLAIAGDLLVDLRATDPTAATATWNNLGTLGDFTRVGNPQVQTVAGVAAVTLNGDHPAGGWDDAYQGPLAPAAITGSGTRSIELWAYNPADGLQQGEETAVAWGRRGGPGGTNLTFGFGNNPTWGAVGHWDTPDMPWTPTGGSPTLGQWHHLVYTYDGSTARLYSDGVQTYSEVVGALGTHANTTINLGAQNAGNGLLTLIEGQPGSLSLANVRIHTGVLTPANIVSNFQLGILATSAPPVSVADAYSTNEDSPLSVPAPGVLANDQNPSGLTLVAVLGTGPANGALGLASNGSFTYEPNPNFNGTDSFTYYANSGSVPSTPVTVTITVNPRYDAAATVADNYLVAKGQLLTVPAATGLLANDINPDNLTLTVTVTDSTDNGILTPQTNGSFTYQPNANFAGIDTFQYRVFDTVGNSNISTVTIRVDSPPAADNESYSTNEDTPLTVSAALGVLTGDTDAENDPLTAVLVTPPVHGALILNPNGSFTYTPTTNYAGTDSFTYRASDGDQESNVATVTLTIAPINDSPEASDDLYFGFQDETIVATTQNSLLANDRDVDGPSISAILVSGPLSGTLNFSPNGTFTYTPGAGFIGTDEFTYKVSDTLAESEVVTVTLVVNTADAQVVINELHYEPVYNNVPEEFLELYNNGETPVDLSGWRFTDGIDYRFPDGAVIMPGQYLVVAEDPTTMFELWGIDAYGPWEGSLSNDGEEITLRNGLGIQVDRVEYGLGFPWPTSVAGDGPSMELINPNLDNDLGGSWRASTIGSEPRPAVTLLGQQNSNWRYRKGTTAASTPTTAWREPEFALDGTWLSGQTSIGYGDNDDLTLLSDMQNGYTSVYLRNSFDIPSAAAMPQELRLRVYVDDGAIIWINGQEVARRYMAAGEIPHTGTGQSHDAAWEELTIQNPGSFLEVGANTIAIHAFNTTLGSSDFSIDVEIIDPGTEGLIGVPTPGEQNSNYAENAPPQIRQVDHVVATPAAGQANVVTAKVTDPNGVASVALHYQVVLPGAFIPSTLPVPISQMIAGNIPTARTPNPAFENPANWTTVQMVDNGTNGDAIANDGVYSMTIPGQINRALVRYRITVTDTAGASVRVPYVDDPSLNFAYYTYNGIPDYQGVSSEALETLPVYTIVSRERDIYEAVAHDPAVRLPQFLGSAAHPARDYENWEMAFVYDGKVYDHIYYRLGGANGRYQNEGNSNKRNWRIRFNRGNFLEARDQDGERYSEEWRTLTIGKGMSNRLTLTYGLNEVVNYHLWNTVGVPAPDTHWFHMRVVDGAEEAPNAYQGDFWGMQWAQETYDVRFLEAHGLERGNLYKLVNATNDPLEQERYLAADAVRNGEDMTNIETNLRSFQTTAWLRAHVDYDKWNRYHALAQAIRHYDYWPDANKNATWYFAPNYTAENSNLGQMWTLPWDTDATWGPTYNCGEDRPYDAIFPSCDGRGDPGGNAELAREYRNMVREIRDLLWQPEQISGIINSFASDIAAFMPAERIRFNTVPANFQSQLLPNVVGNYGGIGNNYELSGYVQDMLNFAFTGGNWPGGAVGVGGQAAWLDQLQASGGDGALLPTTPTISYVGQANFPIDGLAFRSSNFADPQGAGTFKAMQWRVGEITDPTAPSYDPNNRYKLEFDAAWESPVITTFNNTVSVPAGNISTGATYRARVRMMDTTGVWSHWSAPVTFTTTGPAHTQELIDHLRVTEVMYNPPAATPAELSQGFTDQDFEFLELTNTGDQLLNLSQVRIVDGVTFNFAGKAITTLLPGASVLVVRSIAGFESRYGTHLPVAGAFEDDTALANGGERLKIEDLGDTLIQEFTFDDAGVGWHPSTDGEGYSLVIINANGPVLSWNNGASWRPSHDRGGSPGSPDLLPGDADGNDAVNLNDVAIVQRNIGLTSGATRAQGDFDNDGDVDRADVARLANNFGRAYTPPAPSPSAPAAVLARSPRHDGVDEIERTAANRLAANAARRATGERTSLLLASHVDRALDDVSAEVSTTTKLRARRITRP